MEPSFPPLPSIITGKRNSTNFKEVTNSRISEHLVLGSDSLQQALQLATSTRDKVGLHTLEPRLTWFGGCTWQSSSHAAIKVVELFKSPNQRPLKACEAHDDGVHSKLLSAMEEALRLHHTNVSNPVGWWYREHHPLHLLTPHQRLCPHLRWGARMSE